MVMSGNNNSVMDDEAEEEEDGGLVIGDSYNGGQHRANTVSVLLCNLFYHENYSQLLGGKCGGIMCQPRLSL